MYVTYEFFIKISILYIIFFVTKFPFWGGVDGGRPLCFGMCDGVTYDRNVISQWTNRTGCCQYDADHLIKFSQKILYMLMTK